MRLGLGIAAAVVAHVLQTFALAEVDLGLDDCPAGADLCGDPHMKGLRGQRISFSGTDGGWYNFIHDRTADLAVNVRLTAPLPEEFPLRQLITGVSVISEGHSLTIEVRDPYGIHPAGCPYSDIAPCLANGGLRVAVDGEEADEGLLRFSRHEHVAGGISVSAANLPVECREFGADKIWARMYQDKYRSQRRRKLMASGGNGGGGEESFESWIRTFGRMAALDWCVRVMREVEDEGTIFGGTAVDPPEDCLGITDDLPSPRTHGEGANRGTPSQKDERFEQWILGFGHMAAPDWCLQYIADHGLADVQSTHAVFKITTPAATIRLVVGVNYQAEGEIWKGRTLPDLEFWQMNVGLLDASLSLDTDVLSGLLGETSRPVLSEDGSPIMQGFGAFRGAVEDYRVASSLDTDFALLQKKERLT